nr:methylmalonyl Co-A mutase-associated GTPase MeaB [Pseudovibrio stylochi]
MNAQTALLATNLTKGNRAALARAITLVESKKAAHRQQAEALLAHLMAKTGNSLRLGITGVPGVGKSTTIDSFGSNLTAMGHKVAVLAVDPSSTRHGGSILGDKTRMERLSYDENAFIRPSPTAGTLGGVAAKTRETMLLCEAAGYDIIIVETVGIGQSETTVAQMVDFFLVLMLPGAGDDLQGIKKGVLEIADLIAVNKADGDNEVRARAAASEYRAALNIMSPRSPHWNAKTLLISGLKNIGLDALWDEIEQFRAVMVKEGVFDKKRSQQQIDWMWSLLQDKVMSALQGDPSIQSLIPKLKTSVYAGELPATAAASKLAAAFFSSKKEQLF